MKLKAKNLILDLLLAAREMPLTARDAVAACGLFGITENNVRVTLARLSAEGLIESAGRGNYRLAPRARRLGGEIASWREAESRLRAWAGDYVAVHESRPPRSDRDALRQHDRALDMMGFRALHAGLYLRPNNIEPDIDSVRARLAAVGLSAGSTVFSAAEFSARDRERIAQLWDRDALEKRYLDQRERLDAWLDRYAELEAEVAARECFLLGNEAVRLIVFDPLLPDAMIDAKARGAFFAAMRRFDDVGHDIWRALYESFGGMPRTAEPTLILRH